MGVHDVSVRCREIAPSQHHLFTEIIDPRPIRFDGMQKYEGATSLGLLSHQHISSRVNPSLNYILIASSPHIAPVLQTRFRYGESANGITHANYCFLQRMRARGRRSCVPRIVNTSASQRVQIPLSRRPTLALPHCMCTRYTSSNCICPAIRARQAV